MRGRGERSGRARLFFDQGKGGREPDAGLRASGRAGASAPISALPRRGPAASASRQAGCCCDRPEPLHRRGWGAAHGAGLGAVREVRNPSGAPELHRRAGGRDIGQEELFAMVDAVREAAASARVPPPRLLFTAKELQEVRKLQMVAKGKREMLGERQRLRTAPDFVTCRICPPPTCSGPAPHVRRLRRTEGLPPSLRSPWGADRIHQRRGLYDAPRYLSLHAVSRLLALHGHGLRPARGPGGATPSTSCSSGARSDRKRIFRRWC